jgi:hypothetical protein
LGRRGLLLVLPGRRHHSRTRPAKRGVAGSSRNRLAFRAGHSARPGWERPLLPALPRQRLAVRAGQSAGFAWERSLLPTLPR